MFMLYLYIVTIIPFAYAKAYRRYYSLCSRIMQMVTHLLSKSGIFTITVIITCLCCSNTDYWRSSCYNNMSLYSWACFSLKSIAQLERWNYSFINVSTKTACTLLPYSILNQIKVDTTYLRTVILTASLR